MNIRYFTKLNAARPVIVGDDIFTFEICDQVANSWRGVYKDTEGTFPESAIYSEQNPAGSATEITEALYLEILQKKRPSLTAQVEAVDNYKAPGKSPAPAPTVPKVSENEVPPEKLDEVSGLEAAASQSIVGNYKLLAEATGRTIEELQELNKREDSPGRSTKGYKVSDWIQFVAAANLPPVE